MDSSTELNLVSLVDPTDIRERGLDLTAFYIFKRIIDVVISFIVLLFLLPVMVIIAILIKLDSPGPVFFRQTRVGSQKIKDGESFLWKRHDFSIYKFRSMVNKVSVEVHREYIKAYIDNDEEKMTRMEGTDSGMHKLVNDSRITKVGKILRKLSLDEIPQFWNVIRGEMSLIGPRPALPYEVNLYSPRHMRRLDAKPGISGLQQTTARCIISFDDQVNLDIDYVENQSLWLDIKLLLKTPITVFVQKGA